MQGIADYEFVRPLGESNYGTNYLANDASAPWHRGRRGRRQGDRRADVRRRVPTRHPRAEALQRRRLRPAGRGLRRRSTRRRVLLRDGVPPARLAREAQRGPRPGRAVAAVRDAALAAHALHERGIAHRDIKPANILLADDGGRLSDLGLSQLLSPGMVMTGLGQIGLEFTDPPIMLGAGSLARQRHLVAGRLPPLRPDRARRLRRPAAAPSRCCSCASILASQPTLAPDLSPAAAELIGACLATDVTARPRTAAEVAERASGLAAGAGV